MDSIDIFLFVLTSISVLCNIIVAIIYGRLILLKRKIKKYKSCTYTTTK